MEQDKFDRILKELRYWEIERVGFQKLLENHNRETDEVEKGIKGFAVNLEEPSEAIRREICILNGFSKHEKLG
jgi:hypothetical protein